MKSIIISCMLLLLMVSIVSANCYNGLQDVDEENVDCGGDCVSCDTSIELLMDYKKFPSWKDTYDYFNYTDPNWENFERYFDKWYIDRFGTGFWTYLIEDYGEDKMNWPVSLQSGCIELCQNTGEIYAMGGGAGNRGSSFIRKVNKESNQLEIVDWVGEPYYHIQECVYSPNDESIYIMGGWREIEWLYDLALWRTTNEIYKFDCNSEKSEKLDLELKGYEGTGYFDPVYSEADNSIYIFGYGWNNGYFNHGYKRDIFKFDLTNKEVIDTGIDLGNPAHASVTVYDPVQEVIYLFGGYFGENVIQKYDVNTKELTKLQTTLPVRVNAADGGSDGFYYDGKIYLFAKRAYNKSLIFDPITEEVGFSFYDFPVVEPEGMPVWNIFDTVFDGEKTSYLLSSFYLYSMNLDNLDSDGDGVLDDVDMCQNTKIPETTVPEIKLGVNRFALLNEDLIFDTTLPKGKGPQVEFTLEDTKGCSCEQILSFYEDEMKGHWKFGCSKSVMEDWIESL